MTENSENAEQLPKGQEELPEPTEQLPKKTEVAEEAAAPVPKAKGRPRGSRDSAPRVRRVPVSVPAARVAKQVRVREPEPEPPEPVLSDPEPEPEPAPKSPRTLRKERMQELAEQRRAMQQAEQARFDRVLDRFMGY